MLSPIAAAKKTFRLACGATLTEGRLITHLLEWCVREKMMGKASKARMKTPNQVLKALQSNYESNRFNRHVALAVCQCTVEDCQCPSPKNLRLPPYKVILPKILESRQRYSWIHKGSNHSWISKKRMRDALKELDPGVEKQAEESEKEAPEKSSMRNNEEGKEKAL